MRSPLMKPISTTTKEEKQTMTTKTIRNEAGTNLGRTGAAETIYEYFTNAFGWEPEDETLRELPVDSPCGADCKNAIDTGVAFAKHTKQAYPETVDAVAQLAYETVEVYWRG